MNGPLFLFGVVGTVLLIITILIAFADGWRAAVAVVGTTIGLLAALVGVIAFWAWVAGAFT